MMMMMTDIFINNIVLGSMSSIYILKLFHRIPILLSIRYDVLLNEFLVEEYLPLSFIHHILRNFFVPLQILTEVTS